MFYAVARLSFMSQGGVKLRLSHAALRGLRAS
jgi:hypothetical protein